MFTCTKCGKKAKTSYERTFGEKPTFEPVGFYCHTCGIFYDVGSKSSSKVVYGVAKKEDGGVRSTVAAETYTNAAQTVYENEQERIQKVPVKPEIEHKITLDHLCVRQVS